MLQNFTALNTMYRKTHEKQATYRTPKGTEKKLDYILVDRKYIYCSRNAEANDMIHMGSCHRSAITQLLHQRKSHKKVQHSDKKKKRTQRAKMTTQRDLAKLTSRTQRRTRKKNQVQNRNCSHHTEAEKYRVFDIVEASGRSCRCWNHSGEKDTQNLLQKLKQHTIRLSTQTPQPPNPSTRK